MNLGKIKIRDIVGLPIELNSFWWSHTDESGQETYHGFVHLPSCTSDGDVEPLVAPGGDLFYLIVKDSSWMVQQPRSLMMAGELVENTPLYNSFMQEVNRTRAANHFKPTYRIMKISLPFKCLDQVECFVNFVVAQDDQPVLRDGGQFNSIVYCKLTSATKPIAPNRPRLRVVGVPHQNND